MDPKHVNYDAYIGTLNWEACLTCRHYPPERGGCLVGEQVDGEMYTDGDTVFCGCYDPITREEMTP